MRSIATSAENGALGGVLLGAPTHSVQPVDLTKPARRVL